MTPFDGLTERGVILEMAAILKCQVREGREMLDAWPEWVYGSAKPDEAYTLLADTAAYLELLATTS